MRCGLNENDACHDLLRIVSVKNDTDFLVVIEIHWDYTSGSETLLMVYLIALDVLLGVLHGTTP